MRRKAIAIALTASAVALVGAGCGDDEGGEASSGRPEVAPVSKTKGPKGESATPSGELKVSAAEVEKLKSGGHTAALVWHTRSDFVAAVTAGARDEFARLGIDVVAETDAGFDAGRQKSDVETVLAKKPGAIVALPVDPVATASAFRGALKQGTKLVFLSNVPENFEQGDDYVTVVTDDLFEMGKQAADALATDLGEKGNVGWIYHDADYYVTNQRDEAFKTTIEQDYPEMRIVDEAGIADPARAEDIANAMVTKNPDLDGIYVTWAEPAEGVLSALRNAGNAETKVVTLDLSEPVALDMVKGGNVTALVADEAYELGRALATSVGYGLLDKQAPPFVVAPALTVTGDAVEEGWQRSLHRDPPKAVMDAAQG
jgi:ribose transport system substrate-binding protein